MAYLTINGKEYEAKTNFKFERTANDKYNEADKEGNKQGGLVTIYSGLLEYDVLYLAAFWDCALAYIKVGKPTLEDIEKAIEDFVEEHGDLEPLFKAAFKRLDDSGFFRSKVKKFWKNVELMRDFVTEEKEKKAVEEIIEEMETARSNLTA